MDGAAYNNSTLVDHGSHLIPSIEQIQRRSRVKSSLGQIYPGAVTIKGRVTKSPVRNVGKIVTHCCKFFFFFFFLGKKWQACSMTLHIVFVVLYSLMCIKGIVGKVSWGCGGHSGWIWYRFTSSLWKLSSGSGTPTLFSLLFFPLSLQSLGRFEARGPAGFCLCTWNSRSITEPHIMRITALCAPSAASLAPEKCYGARGLTEAEALIWAQEIQLMRCTS